MRLPPALPWPSTRMLIGLTAGLVAVAVLAGGGWLWSAAHQQRGAAAYADVLGRLATSSQRPLTPEAKAAVQRDLEAALASYPSAALAGQAAYLLGNLRYDDRDYARARAAYEVAMARSASKTIRTLARAGVGYTWEAERNFPQAVEAYQAGLSGLKPTDFQYEELLIDLARAQELAGRRDEAIQSYRRVLRDVPKGLRADDVLTRLATLGAL
jgi:tetratricopeptide (TPR) repeat protein